MTQQRLLNFMCHITANRSSFSSSIAHGQYIWVKYPFENKSFHKIVLGHGMTIMPFVVNMQQPPPTQWFFRTSQPNQTRMYRTSICRVEKREKREGT